MRPYHLAAALALLATPVIHLACIVVAHRDARRQVEATGRLIRHINKDNSRL